MAEGKIPAPGQEAREAIYQAIEVWVKQKTNYRLGRSGSKKLFESMIDVMMAEIIKAGYFRLPLGYGTFKVKIFKARPSRSLPRITGKAELDSTPMTVPTDRPHLRYREGATVYEALGFPRSPRQRTKVRQPLAVQSADSPPV